MNKLLRSLIFAPTLAAACLLGTAATTQAQTAIMSLPYTISASGSYVLNSNLNSSLTSGNLITVNASNVTIDFQSHYIAAAVGNTSQSTAGIYANEQSNLTVKNGTIAYCNVGIALIGNNTSTTNSVGHQIDNMRVTYCYDFGIFSQYNPGCRITNCQITQGGYSGATLACGIRVQGAGTTVSSCVVSTVSGTYSSGITLDTGSFARQNTTSNCYYGVYQGKYQDNLTYGCTQPYSGGTDAGGNN